MTTREYKEDWERPDHPLKNFGDRPFTKNAAWCRVGVSCVNWALREGLLIERGDGLLQLAPDRAA